MDILLKMDELRCVNLVYGAQCVIIYGIEMMLWLYAGNWEYHSQVKHRYTVLANRSVTDVSMYLFLQLPMLETLV